MVEKRTRCQSAGHRLCQPSPWEGARPGSRSVRRAERRRHDDLSLPDLPCERDELTSERRGDERAEPPELHPVVAEGEVQIAARGEPAMDETLGEVVDSHVQVLDDAGEDEAAEVRLVDVDTYSVNAQPLGGLESCDAARAGDVEHHRRVLVNLLTSGVHTRPGCDERVAIRPQQLDLGVRAPRSRLEARDVRVHARDPQAADRADDVGRRAAVGDARCDESGQIGGLLGVEDGPLQICRGTRDAVASRVEYGELQVGELVRGPGDRTGLEESNADHEVVMLPGELEEGGEPLVAHARWARRDRLRLDVQVALRAQPPAIGSVLERIAFTADEDLLEDEADLGLPAPARGRTRARYGEDRR